MTIKEAKRHIEDTVKVYLTKDEFGRYVVPVERQRPVFLLGAPGIGKTAIMEQIARELDIALVSYSMTHHTRQSALGLPQIVKKNYGGEEFSVSEYTMSEILVSVYDVIEKSGKKEGILFLDEINCVSETLAPIMLQFLQYKTFGRHRVPDGWIVVTAGNPPEYNKSVREFDVVTWDRLKKITVDPDFDAWREYAGNAGVHPAVLSYLETKRANFYSIENTPDGKSFVTARGWDDLSRMLHLYEQLDIPADISLIVQYIQSPRIARDFAGYYDLFRKYRSDYRIDSILDGSYEEIMLNRAKAARFDERLSLIGMIADSLFNDSAVVARELKLQKMTADALGKLHADISVGCSPEEAVQRMSEMTQKELDVRRAAGNLDWELQRCNDILMSRTADYLREVSGVSDGAVAFMKIKEKFMSEIKAADKLAEKVRSKLSCAFRFLDEAFGDGQEMVFFVTQLTINTSTSAFITRYGCDEYFAHNKGLCFHDRQKELMERIRKTSPEK